MNEPKTQTETSTAVAVEVQSKLDVKHIEQIERRGKAIVAGMGKVGTLYADLVAYIRANQVAKKVVSDTLSRLGFKRGAISKINRVAGLADNLFKSYEAKLIGFNEALELARADKPGNSKLTDAGRLLVEGGSVSGDEADGIAKETGDASSGTGRTSKTMGQKLKAAACFIAANDRRKTFTWKFKEGTVTWLAVAPEDEIVGSNRAAAKKNAANAV